MELSRYLYEKSEVRASFINSLLKRKKPESLFWISEFFLSGWHQETLHLLWEVYYDFYYIYHSKMEKKLLNILKDVNLKNILTATTTLYYLKEKTTYTFELRLIIKNTRIPSVNYIYKQIPEQYKVYKHKHFIYSIVKQHIINIGYYFQQANNNSSTITVSDIYSDIKKLLGIDSFLHKNKTIQQHMFIASISRYALFGETTPTIRIRNALFHIESTLLKVITNEETDVAKQHPYRILENQRKYEIDDDIGLDHFSLPRFQDDILNKKDIENSVMYNIYYHWEYYAYNTPIWMARFTQYKGIQNHTTKEVEFPCEELAEQFYENYAYEPDEQSHVTNIKSAKNITEIQYNVWRSNVFLG